MGDVIQSTLKELLGTCEKYENYRRSMKPVYFELLVCLGMEDYYHEDDIEKWQVRKFRVRSKNETKPGMLLKIVEELITTYWAKNNLVIGEKEVLAEIEGVLEQASTAENETHQNLINDLYILYNFFNNGYELMKSDAIALAGKATAVEHEFATDPKKQIQYEKAAKKFKLVHEKIVALVGNLESTQTIHAETIRAIFLKVDILNKTLCEIYKKFEGIHEKKYLKDSKKKSLIEQEERKIKSECEKHSVYMDEDVKPEEGN